MSCDSRVYLTGSLTIRPSTQSLTKKGRSIVHPQGSLRLELRRTGPRAGRRVSGAPRGRVPGSFSVRIPRAAHDRWATSHLLKRPASRGFCGRPCGRRRRPSDVRPRHVVRSDVAESIYRSTSGRSSRWLVASCGLDCPIADWLQPLSCETPAFLAHSQAHRILGRMEDLSMCYQMAQSNTSFLTASEL